MIQALSRRHALALLGFGTLATGLLPKVGFASAPGSKRLVVIVLRGGMDGLHAVPPVADPGYALARGSLALDPKICVELGNGFALHPALQSLHAFWDRDELTVVHAVASPYRERSHFDAQDVLETGTSRPHERKDGWLNQMILALDGRRGDAIAISKGMPQILRGEAPASSWAPSPLPGLPPELVEKMAALYALDPTLAYAFEEGVQADAMAEAAIARAMEMDDPAQPPKKGAADFASLARAAGQLLAAPDGPRIATLDLGGWDTHQGQGLDKGRMSDALDRLGAGLVALEQGLGAEAWSQTVVVAMSEFGRAVEVNGTGGTDHGTGGAMFLLGGAVAGGRVIVDWPGLALAQRHENRDLMPTVDLRSVLKGVLSDHLGVSKAALDGAVFPGSDVVLPMKDLVKA